jgi:hypothetical protein
MADNPQGAVELSSHPRQFRGAFVGILGAVRRHSGGVYISCSSCRNPVVVVLLLVEMWKCLKALSARLRQEKEQP